MIVRWASSTGCAVLCLQAMLAVVSKRMVSSLQRGKPRARIAGKCLIRYRLMSRFLSFVPIPNSVEYAASCMVANPMTVGSAPAACRSPCFKDRQALQVKRIVTLILCVKPMVSASRLFCRGCHAHRRARQRANLCNRTGNRRQRSGVYWRCTVSLLR